MGQTSEQRLKVTETNWEEKPDGNGYLLGEVFDLLLRDSEDLTDGDGPLTMPLETVEDEEGGDG